MSQRKKASWNCVRIAVLFFLVAASAVAAQAQVVFSPPKNISNSSGNTQSQQIAVDANGNVNLVWVDNSLGNYAIFFSRSSDGGNTFSTPRSISKHAQSTASGPKIGVDSAGNISVVWTETSPDGSANFIYFSHSTDGVKFTNPHNISGDAGMASGPQIAVEVNGNINVVWADTSLGNSEVFFSRSTDGGTSFSAPLNVSNDAFNSRGQQIAVDPNGNINVAWEDDTVGFGHNDVFFSRSSDGGASFSAPLAITHSSQHSYAGFPLQIATGSNGIIYVLWISITPNLLSFESVVLSRSTDGGATFSATGGGNFSSFGVMAIDSTGNDIGLALSNDIDTGFPFVTFSLSSDAGFSGFAGPQVSRTPNIVVDAVGRFDMTYDAGGLFNETPCFCFAQSPGGNTATITSVPVGRTAMAVDAGGNVYIAWLQSATARGNSNVFFSRGAVPPFSFSVSPGRVIGGFGSSTGTLKLVSPAPAGGATISLASSNPSVVSVPSTVTIPEGASSATFSIGTSEVTSLSSATITATYNGTNTANLFVEPLFNFSVFDPIGGTPTTFSVFLNEPAPSGGLVVALSSSDPSILSVPASVTIPAGSRFGSFSVTTTPVSTPTTVQITGTVNGFTQTTSVTVRPPVFVFLSLSPSTATGGIAQPES